jgi:type II secretory pathway component PulM
MDLNAFTKVRERLRGMLARPFRYFSAEWERMAPRERRWVTGLSITVLVVATALGLFLVFSSISDLEEGNADIREALGTIAKNRDEYLEAKARAQAQEQRLGSDPPQIVADIEAAAREETVQIAESNERPPLGAGKRWIEHDVDLKIRGVDLQALSNFLRRAETGPRPIFFTRLSIKRRFSEADKLDAELTATAFERVKETAAAKKKPEGKAQPEPPTDSKGRSPGRSPAKGTP